VLVADLFRSFWDVSLKDIYGMLNKLKSKPDGWKNTTVRITFCTPGTLAQPEWGRRGHGPSRKKLA